jgi:hypothetical protein
MVAEDEQCVCVGMELKNSFVMVQEEEGHFRKTCVIYKLMYIVIMFSTLENKRY